MKQGKEKHRRIEASVWNQRITLKETVERHYGEYREEYVAYAYEYNERKSDRFMRKHDTCDENNNNADAGN